MAKSKPRSRGIPLLMLLAVARLSLMSCESDGDRVGELRNLQERSPGGVIPLDDASLQRFAVEPKSRSYSLIILFDAGNNPELRREYRSMARAFSGRDPASRVFFCEIEFQQAQAQAQASLDAFGVGRLPHLRHVGPHHRNLNDSDAMDRPESAEGMAAFVESKTKQRVGPGGRNPPGSAERVAFAAGVLVLLLLLAAAFVAKRLLTRETPLGEPKIWLAFALLVYFFGVSGLMNNIIRKVPLYVVNRSQQLVFFLRRPGLQLGAEGVLVGCLYTVVGLLLAFVTHFLGRVESRNMQRLFMAVAIAVSYRAVRTVVSLDNLKTGYEIHGFWPSRWR